MKIVEKVRKVLSDHEFKAALRKYLVRNAEERKDPWRSRRALNQTVDDVLALDADLLDYVRAFVADETRTDADPGCEAVSVAELVAGGSTPVQAALTVQWYRREPRAAAEFLVQHDKVTDIDLEPKAGPEEEKGEEDREVQSADKAD